MGTPGAPPAGCRSTGPASHLPVDRNVIARSSAPRQSTRSGPDGEANGEWGMANGEWQGARARRAPRRPASCPRLGSAKASLRGAARRGNLRDPGASFTELGLGVLPERGTNSQKSGARRLPRRSVLPVPRCWRFEPETRLAFWRSSSQSTPRNDVFCNWVLATRGALA